MRHARIIGRLRPLGMKIRSECLRADPRQVYWRVKFSRGVCFARLLPASSCFTRPKQRREKKGSKWGHTMSLLVSLPSMVEAALKRERTSKVTIFAFLCEH
jgi:hypothetical protein